MPAQNLLTERAIERARVLSEEYELNDGDGLCLRIKPDFRRVWMLRYTSPATGKRRRMYLGAYPTVGLRDARNEATKLRTLVADGIDPSHAAPLIDSEGNTVPASVARLFDVWFKGHVKRYRTSDEDQKAIKTRYCKYVDPYIGRATLATVKRGQCMMVIDSARMQGVMRTTNLILAEMRQMFRYAVTREWIASDPTAAITRKDAGGSDVERDRVLSDRELVMLRCRLRKAPKVLPIRTELAVWWTLATAARAIEVATLSPSDVCLETRTWTIPAEVAKNTDAHVVHLSEFALYIWSALERMAGPVWVFEGRTEGAHLSEKEVTRRLVDRQTRDAARSRRKNTTELDLPGGHWTQHDLRRTAATIMGELGIAPEVIDRCLNHREAKKVTRTYQRQKMLPQRKAAFEALGAHLIETVGHPRSWLPQSSKDSVAKELNLLATNLEGIKPLNLIH